jgi:hypothetical protein
MVIALRVLTLLEFVARRQLSVSFVQSGRNPAQK